MKKLPSFLSLLIVQMICTSAFAIVRPGEYYIQNDYFSKLLSVNSSKPQLMTYSRTNDADYIFVAEESSDASYVKLRHKATGKYITASTSNTYSVLLSDAGNGDQYLWRFDDRFSTVIVSKKSTDKRLGCDYSREDNVSVFYDKKVGALNWFTIIPADGNGFESSLANHKTGSYTNDFGNMQEDCYRVNCDVEVSNEDYHVVSAKPFNGGKVNLSGDKAWLIFDSIRPSTVISNHLSKVTIDGAIAVSGKNCRVEIWLNGAAVIPFTATGNVLLGYSELGQQGDERALTVKNYTTLGDGFNNRMRSFTLRRGYMATLASGRNGEGYSRVYVADHNDLVIDLPKALDRRVTSVHIRPWHYTGKRGYASGNTGENNALNSSWRWNWDANLTTSDDLEYIPIRQHRYWPSYDAINKEGSTAMMLINEPEHSEQHNNCDCGGTTDEWTAYTITPQFNATGMRIGSPSATDLGWIKNYTTHCDNMAQRCDFVCTHGYWSSDWGGRLGTMWENSKRPIWITEWEYGSSWDSYHPSGYDEYAKHVLEVLDMLEYDNRVERYSYYGVDGGGTGGYYRLMFYEYNPSKGTTPAGDVYKKVKTHFAYNASWQHVPNWWAPQVSAPVISKIAEAEDTGEYTFTVTNKNGDVTESITLQGAGADGNWVDIQTITDRYLFDYETCVIKVDASELENYSEVRISLKSLYGDIVNSPVAFIRFKAIDELTNLTFDEGSFLTQGVLTYKKDVTEAIPLAQMQPVTGWNILENGDARASGMYTWGSPLALGSSEYTVPTEGYSKEATGGCLGIVSVWTAKAQYIQSVKIPAGTWKITVPVYNIGKGMNLEKNYIGFVASDGTEYLAKTKSYPVGLWTVEEIEINADKPILGYITLGYEATNNGSSSSPHLAIDYVEITGKPEEDPQAIAPQTSDTFIEGNTLIYNGLGQPVHDNCVPGFYIIKTGNKAQKVIVR